MVSWLGELDGGRNAFTPSLEYHRDYVVNETSGVQ
jgi:hypothetical protein